VDRQQLGADELAQVRAAVLELDRRAFQFGGPYINTAPAEGPPTQTVETPVVTPPNTNPPDSRPTVPTNPQPLTLTLDRSKSTVRRALTQRLRKWRITSVKCKRDSRTRVNCTFVATTKRGSRATGTAAVTRRGAEGLVRYVLTAKVVKGGCHPAASKKCTRRSTWRSRWSVEGTARRIATTAARTVAATTPPMRTDAAAGSTRRGGAQPQAAGDVGALTIPSAG
jgi:hypothetical protein